MYLCFIVYILVFLYISLCLLYIYRFYCIHTYVLLYSVYSLMFYCNIYLCFIVCILMLRVRWLYPYCGVVMVTVLWCNYGNRIVLYLW